MSADTVGAYHPLPGGVCAAVGDILEVIFPIFIDITGIWGIVIVS